jgi:DUF4097 and DUF4098 domain-containing protein YvlB
MKGIIAVILAAGTVFLLFSCSAPVEVTKEESLELPAGAVEFLEIRSGDGELDISGISGAEVISVQAEIVATGSDEKSIQKALDNELELELQRRGNRAVLDAGFADSFFLLDLISSSEKLVHLVVTIPDDMEVRITDSAGDLYIQQVHNSCTIRDSSGDIIVEDSGGPVEITDTDDDILLSDIQGNLTIDDTGGEIEAASVRGEITIQDGAGNINISDVTGRVYLHDNTGSITIEKVRGDVSIVGGGKGNVRIREVEGEITQNY